MSTPAFASGIVAPINYYLPGSPTWIGATPEAVCVAHSNFCGYAPGMYVANMTCGIVPGSAVINPPFCNSYTEHIDPVCPDHSKPSGATTCTCDDPYFPDTAKKSCVLETYVIELTPASATIEPGESYTFTAKVKIKDQNGQLPNKPVPVSVKVEVEAKSGGHDHDEGRPKGEVSPASGEKEFQITFKSTPISGTHKITVTCELCENKTADAVVTVKVDGLSSIPALPFYALNEANGDVIGARVGWHTDNHNLTHAAALKLLKIAILYRFNPKFFVVNSNTNQKNFPPVLHLNDASLPWGGVYDICARPGACSDLGTVAWQEPHAEHRRGTVVDVRANGVDGSIPSSNKVAFVRLLSKNKIPYLHEAQGSPNEHFHLRLLGKRE